MPQLLDGSVHLILAEVRQVAAGLCCDDGETHALCKLHGGRELTLGVVGVALEPYHAAMQAEQIGCNGLGSSVLRRRESVPQHDLGFRELPRLEEGKTEGADCFLKTSEELFLKLIRGEWSPGAMDFMSGKIKSNDPFKLKLLKDCFSI